MAQRYYGLQPVLADNFEGAKQEPVDEVQKQVPPEKEEIGRQQEKINASVDKVQYEAHKERRNQPDNNFEKQEEQKEESLSHQHSVAFCEGRVVSILSDKTVIIETVDSNGLKVGDIVAVPQLQ